MSVLDHDAAWSAPAPIAYARVGVMIGPPNPASGFPSGTRFTPYTVLRNATANPLSVKANLNRMSGGAPFPGGGR